MQKKTDRRVRKTKTQLRNGLAMLMKEKSVGEITVKELVDQVDINRSTFYLHYPDISGLLYEIENDLAEEMERAIREHPIEKREDNGFYFLQDIFQVLDNNREIVSGRTLRRYTIYSESGSYSGKKQQGSVRADVSGKK